MWRIVYKNDSNRVLLTGAESIDDCVSFLMERNLDANNYLIQQVM